MKKNLTKIPLDGNKYYYCNKKGDVFSKRNNSIKKLKPSNNNGYMQVVLYLNGKPKTIKVHRLICTTFLNIDKLKIHVNHLNGIRNDNRLSNLEWSTPKDNIRHSYNELKRKGSNLGRFNHKSSKPIIQMDIKGSIIMEWDSAREAERNGYSHNSIWRCCNGVRLTYKGYKWKYKYEKEFREN